jgi:alpha-glucosidase
VPNNWLSIFGGSAWQWDTRRKQYYLHNFLTSQPDLNFHCPAVQEAILGTVKFWLDLGVDGYRLDTANFYVHDALLRDNPPRGMPTGEDPAVSSVNPYAWQWHKHDKSQPENIAFLKKLRSLLNQYPDTTMVGEIGDDDGLARLAEYTSGGDKLHMAYCFDLLGNPHDAPYLHGVMSRFNEVVGDGWPCWALSNHDVPRVATRWGGATPDQGLLRLAAALQMSLRGSPSLYQGDELGLPEVDITFEELQDPYGKEMWPEFKGRDGCRTPMPWTAAQTQAGFSTAANTWLPVAKTHLRLAVDQQQDNVGSLLNYYTRLLMWRRGVPALIKGSMQLLPKHPQILAFVREQQGVKVLCVFNFSDADAILMLPKDCSSAVEMHGSGLLGGRLQGNAVHLSPWGGLFASIP